MKQLFTFLCALLVTLFTTAQQKTNINGSHQLLVEPTHASENEIHRSMEAGDANLQLQNSTQRGSMYFAENFLNGFDGNNAFGAWSHADSGDDTIWMVANADSPGGAYSTAIAALNSGSSSDGWIIFDCDLYQDGEISTLNPAIDVSGYLTSPIIDLTSAPSVILEFQQYFRYCCQSSKPIFVEVTNDGGLSWYVFDGAPTVTAAANVITANPLITKIDISGVAAGQSQVQFRFAWQPNGNSTHSHYFWGIDDVMIYENPIVDDVVVSYVSTGDVLTDFEYRAIPLEQAIPAVNGGMPVGTIYTNLGTNPHVSSIKVEILDAAMNVLAADSVEVEMLSNLYLPNPVDQNDTVFVPTNWQPTEIGTYFARTTISFPETDETPLNNTALKQFFVTADEYGHDDQALLTGRMSPQSGDGTTTPYPPTGFGSYYSIPNEGSIAHGMTVNFTNTTSTNTPITLLLLQQNTSYNLTDAVFVTGAEYDVANIWTPNFSQSFPYYLPYQTPGSMSAGSLYFAGIQTIDEGNFELSIQAMVENDVDFSTGVWARTVAGDYIWFFGIGASTNYSPGLRLILSDRTSVEEPTLPSSLEVFRVNPNPSSTVANLNFALNGSHFIAYEVRDLNGKLMDWKNIGKFSGNNNHTLDVSSYPAGSYVVGLVIDGEHMVTRQMIVQK